MSTPVRRQPRSLLPEVGDWFGSILPTAFRPNMVRIEEYTEDGQYVVRAELPGIDPDRDVEITVADGVLTIKAQRTEKQVENGRSEFHYGSFVRQVALPPGADEENIKASYDNGILTVRMPIGEARSSRKILVEHS